MTRDDQEGDRVIERAIRECALAVLSCARACIACSDDWLYESVQHPVRACVDACNACAAQCLALHNVLTRSSARAERTLLRSMQPCAVACQESERICHMFADSRASCGVVAGASRAAIERFKDLLAVLREVERMQRFDEAV